MVGLALGQVVTQLRWRKGVECDGGAKQSKEEFWATFEAYVFWARYNGGPKVARKSKMPRCLDIANDPIRSWEYAFDHNRIVLGLIEGL